MDEQQIDLGGQRIAYAQSEGQGRPLIFVHGNSASARTWQPLLDGPLGRQFRCLALDLPGHGRSAPARHQGSYSLPGYAAVLVGFAEATGAAGAVVVGWSLGGHIALEAAPAMPAAAGFVIFGTPPVAAAEQMHALIKGSELILLNGGHLAPLLTQHNSLVTQATAFLEREAGR